MHILGKVKMITFSWASPGHSQLRQMPLHTTPGSAFQNEFLLLLKQSPKYLTQQLCPGLQPLLMSPCSCHTDAVWLGWTGEISSYSETSLDCFFLPVSLSHLLPITPTLVWNFSISRDDFSSPRLADITQISSLYPHSSDWPYIYEITDISPWAWSAVQTMILLTL